LGKKSVNNPPSGTHADHLRFVRTFDDLAVATRPWRDKKKKIALVPTMGALHEGHMALITKACDIAERTIVSIFINPQQFAPSEDLDTYPRDEAHDVRLLKAAGVDLVWAPSGESMYPDGFATKVQLEGAALGLETAFRPHFFTGVATVVLKLFNQVAPDIAVFGQKDYQQLCVIRQMVRDLDLGVEIVSVPTVRESDGLALSSRNSYLSPSERALASSFNRVLKEVAAAVSTLGERHDELDVILSKARQSLLDSGFKPVDYIEVRRAETLGPFEASTGGPARVLGAVWLSGTRLIDNVPVPPEE